MKLALKTLTILTAATLASSVLGHQVNDLFGPPPPPPFPPSAEEVAASSIARESDALVTEDRYAEALATAEALVGTRRASYVLNCRLLANIALGRLDEARRIFADEVPPLGSGKHEDRSGGGLPLMRGIQGYLEGRAGRCPEPLWRFLTEEFYDQPAFTKLRATGEVTEFLREVLPTDPSPRTLEFLCIFEFAWQLGPQAQEAMYRRAVELYPLSPVARTQLASSLTRRAGVLVEPDGTVATPNEKPQNTEEERRAWHAYVDSLRFQILDEPIAREVLAHHRIALQYAPLDPRHRKKYADTVWIWERRLGIGQ
jgi:hypothetical protein